MSKNNIQKFGIFFFIGLLLFPLSTAFAWDPIGWVLGGLSGVASDLANAILNVVFTLIAGLVAGIPEIALSFLNWVAGPDFLRVSMTGPDNPIVTEGWGITRNLANVALIFGLVVIAINIILGSQEVQAKKALVNFVLIAVLINFTPVICGVILDASNALTMYFLQEGVRGDLVNYLAQAMADNKDMDFAALIVFFFFGIFSAVIYLLYALLFAARYIVLWILIILSPIAFASKVFPKSRYIVKVFPSFCYWDEWWDQFIQWNVIGIPAGFFIYLSNVAMVEMAAGGFFADASGISIFGRLFTFAMPFIFMAIGFFTTMSSGGAVGSKISGMAKGTWAKTGGRAVGAAKTAAVAGTTGAALGFASGAVAGARSEASLGALRGSLKGAAHGALTGGKEEKEETKRWVQRSVKERLGIVPEGKTAEEEEKLMKESTERIKKLPKERRLELVQSNPTTTVGTREKYAAISASIDEGDLGNEEIKSLIANKESAKKWGFDFKKLSKYAPEHSSELTGKDTRDVISGMTPKDAREKIRVESLNNIVVQASLNEKQRKNINEFGTQKQKDALNDTSTFKNISTDQLMQLSQKDMENLIKNTNKEQLKAFKETFNEKIQELENDGSSDSQTRKNDLLEKMAAAARSTEDVVENDQQNNRGGGGIDQELTS